MEFWQGKFNEDLDKTVEQFVSTFSHDKRLYKQDIMGNMAHCSMLGEHGLIEIEEAKILQKALTETFYEITNGTLKLEGATDIFSFVDNQLTERVGEIAEKANIARSNADRAALDMRMYIIAVSTELAATLKAFSACFADEAEKYQLTVMPSAYHSSAAQPTTLAHSLMALGEQFVRDIERLNVVKSHASVMPLYSAYGTGTRYTINRKRVAQMLKFKAITPNSADALTDCDYIVEFMSTMALVAKHIIKVCDTLIRWTAKYAGYARLGASFTTDSKVIIETDEPIVLETIKIKANKVIALLPATLSALDGDTYGKSFYCVIENVFEADSTVRSALQLLTALLPTIEYNEQVMLKAATDGFKVALDCVDYLINKGSNTEDAYDIVGKLCQYCAENNKRLDTLPFEIYEGMSPLFEKDIISNMRVKNATRLRKHEGECGDVAVRAEIRAFRRKLEKLLS